jgi:predicted ATPase/DNA-binding SARP family transcriptional activator
VRIEILGALRVVTAEGTEVTPRGAQQRRALTALAAAAPGPVSVDALEELLWPTGPPSSNAVQAIVSKLRRVVAPATIAGDGRSYRLQGVETDLADLDRARTSGEWERVEPLVDGTPLADLDGAPFAAPIVAGVVAAVREARRRRVATLVDGPEPGAAIAELESFVTTEPLDEQWWAMLVRAHARCGRQAEALDTYQRARRILAEELGLEPGPALRRAEAEVLSGVVDLAAERASRDERSRPTHRPSVPVLVQTFVGRDREISELSAAIGRHRLITLVGPGGAGKTTTTLELARRAGDETAFAQLATVTDRDGVVRVIARAIGLPESEQSSLTGSAAPLDPLQRVCEALRARSLVIILDNCEHLVDVIASVAHEILTTCAGVRVVATSRASLGVPGEHIYPLPPLPAADAVALLVERAGDHGVRLATDDAEVAAVCERLDGLPLAIELAAARLRTMTTLELHAALDDRFTVLSGGPRLADHRQQTLRSLVDWSHDLLDPVERVVFRRLAVFVGGASAAAARIVCSGPAADLDVTIEPARVLDVLDRLVDQSLVRFERHDGGLRFRMLQTLSAYADERLAASGEREAVMVRHAQFVADDLAPARRGLIGPDQPGWFARVAAERGNLDAAIETALAIGDAQLALEIVVPVGWYFFMAGDIESGADALAGALGCDGPTDPLHRAQALALYGWLLANGPHLEQAVAATSEALSMIDRVEEPFARGLVANTYVMARFFSGHLDAVEAFLPELDEIAAESDDRWVRAITGVVKGEVAQFRGRVQEAATLFAASAADFEAEGDRFAYALTITEASELAEMTGDYDGAAEQLGRGIALAAEVGFSGHPLAMKARLGNIEVLRGDLAAAQRHHEELIEDAAIGGVPWLQAMARLGLAAVARRRGAFQEAGEHLDAAWALPRSRSVPFMRTIVQVARGYLADQQGDHAAALEHQSDGLVTALELRTPRGVAYSFEGVAGALALSTDRSQLRLGAQLLGAADALRRASGGAMPGPERYDVDRAEQRLRSALGDVAFDEASSTGEHAALDELGEMVAAVRAHVLGR